MPKPFSSLPPPLPPPGECQYSLRPAERYNDSSTSGACLRVSFHLHMPKTSPIRGILVRCLNHLIWLLSMLKNNLCWLRSMVLDLKVLILISAAWHSAANHPRAHWRSQLDKTNWTTPSAKTWDAIGKPKDRKSSTTWLHLKILSTKTFYGTETRIVPSGFFLAN